MPTYGRLHILRNSSVRTGMYVGVALSLALGGWVLVANRVPLLDRFAFVRNLAAVSVLGLLALIPVVRFWRVPGNLLASSLVAWSILALSFRAISLDFPGLAERYSAVQLFVLGAVVYMLIVTLSWIGTIIRRARASHVSHPNHPLS